MTKQGMVIKRQVFVGTKSEHEGVCLRTADRDYILRRRGGNAYADTIWDSLIGVNITATGDIITHTFLVDNWEPAVLS